MPDDTEAAEATPAECLEVAEAVELSRREWVETIKDFLFSRLPVPGGHLPEDARPGEAPSDRVQYALDMASIAACERLVRLFNSDNPEPKWEA